MLFKKIQEILLKDSRTFTTYFLKNERDFVLVGNKWKR